MPIRQDSRIFFSQVIEQSRTTANKPLALQGFNSLASIFAPRAKMPALTLAKAGRILTFSRRFPKTMAGRSADSVHWSCAIFLHNWKKKLHKGTLLVL